jgi:signal peptidase I
MDTRSGWAAGAAVLLLAVRASVRWFRVRGLSMEPTLQDGQLLLADMLTYRWLRQPRSGDVIVFRDPRRPGRALVKRVIAMPGETVEIADGLVRVDRIPRRHPSTRIPGWRTWGPETVPPGHYFVLGDYQQASSDSLSWGFLPAGHVIGKVRPWPWDRPGRTAIAAQTQGS